VPAEAQPEVPSGNGGQFEPVNDVERVLARCTGTGVRGSLLRALARSTLCVPADCPSLSDAGIAKAGPLPVPVVDDGDGRHALLYTSYRQLAVALGASPHRSRLRWYEVAAATLFERWPPDVDVWLNAGGEFGLPLDAADLATVADIAAGREVDEAYEVGPDDSFSDFPGPAVPDQVDCAVVAALIDAPEVLEVFRAFRRLDEPQGRTWRIVLVLTDGDVHGEALAHEIVEAINDAADECCEVHVADVHDDGVYTAVMPIMRVGVPLWRREGFTVPDTLEGIDQLDVGPDEPSA
jgi:hypothetical protein